MITEEHIVPGNVFYSDTLHFYVVLIRGYNGRFVLGGVGNNVFDLYADSPVDTKTAINILKQADYVYKGKLKFNLGVIV